jgi:stalled ribosome rescue protein Dom34
MTINAGVWIDHHKAVVILITDDMRQVCSDRDAPAWNHARINNSFSPTSSVAEDKREPQAMIHFNKYYDEVIACLRNADAVLVLGPGEAKGEFAKRFEGQNHKGRIAHMGTVEKMTDRQIGAYVRRLLGTFPSKFNQSTPQDARARSSVNMGK